MSPRKATCAGCPAVVSEDGPYMKCSRCKQIFDTFCANINADMFGTLTIEFKKSWVCVECRSKLPKGDNTHTPVRQQHIQAACTTTNDPPNAVVIISPDNVTMRTAARRALASTKGTGQNELPALKDTVIQELRNLQLDFESQLTRKISNLIVEQFQSLKAEILEKIDELTSKVLQLEEQYKSDAGKGNVTFIGTGQPNTGNNKKTKAPKRKAQTKPIGGVRASSNAPVATTQKNLSTLQDEVLPSVSILGNPSSESTDKETDKDTDNGAWDEVRPRKTRASFSHVLRGTAAPGTTLLRASERWTYLHLYYVQEGTTTEQVRNHLMTICNNDKCTVEELKPRGRYASFKLGVLTRCADGIMSPANWTEDICIKPWRQIFRTQEKRKQQQ